MLVLRNWHQNKTVNCPAAFSPSELIKISVVTAATRAFSSALQLLYSELCRNSEKSFMAIINTRLCLSALLASVEVDV